MSVRVREAIKRAANTGPQVFTATVSDVDADAGTCTLLPSAGGPPRYEAKLFPHPDAAFRIVPVEGSEVMAAYLPGGIPAVVACADVAEIIHAQGPLRLRIDEGGLYLERSGETLLGLLQDLVSEVQAIAQAAAALTVTCAAPGSPSTPPVNLSSFIQSAANAGAVSTRLQTLLKDA